MRVRLPAVCLALAAALDAQDANTARVDRSAALRHYAAVEAELRAAPMPPEPSLAARRGLVIDALRDYRERGDFGVSHVQDGARIPLFIDADGRRCAVAWLLDRTGHGDVTLSIASRCNEAWVAELVGDPTLDAWLANHGVTAAEAVRIQFPIPSEPTPDPTEPSFTPTGGATPASPLTGGTNAAAIETARAGSWLDWWDWNRGAFELPQRAAPVVAPATTSATPQTREEAAALLNQLSVSTHAALRAAAVQALGRIGAGPDQLGKHLDDGAREVRLMALLGMGSGGTAAHAYALATFANSEQQGETLAVALAGMALFDEGAVSRAVEPARNTLLIDRRQAVYASAALAAGASSTEATRAAARKTLRAADMPAKRANAAAALGKHANDADIASLTGLANDRDVGVRRSASLALGRSKHVLALPALMSAFELEPENATQALQLLAIGDHGGDAAKAFLLEQLTGGRKTLRAHAAIALGLWGRDRGANDVAERVAAGFAAERNADQRGAWLLALGLLRHAPSRNLLANEAVVGSTPSTRGGAIAALGLLGDRKALPVLQQVLRTDSCPWCRQQAARALQSLGADAIDTLATAMRQDKDAQVQRAAAFSLGGITDARAPEALLAFAADESQPVAARAGAALGLGRHFRKHEPKLPALRFQHHHLLLPATAAWAFAQEL